MSLFKKKTFPKYPKKSIPSSLPELPRYESQMEVPEEEPEIEQSSYAPSYRAYQPVPEFHEIDLPRRMPSKPELRMPEPMFDDYSKRSQMPQQRRNDEPLFVKIEDYKTAVKNIGVIKSKLNEIEAMIGDVMRLKQQEDAQLTAWHREITEVKTRLLEIDQGLFEVN